MWMLGPIGFTSPLLLLGLIALPILWLLLRAVPPAPIRRRFPGVALLLGLSDDKVETDKTPWWLLLLRALAIGAAIIAFAGPVLNPQVRAVGNRAAVDHAGCFVGGCPRLAAPDRPGAGAGCGCRAIRAHGGCGAVDRCTGIAGVSGRERLGRPPWRAGPATDGPGGFDRMGQGAARRCF